MGTSNVECFPAKRGNVGSVLPSSLRPPRNNDVIPRLKHYYPLWGPLPSSSVRFCDSTIKVTGVVYQTPKFYHCRIRIFPKRHALCKASRSDTAPEY